MGEIVDRDSQVIVRAGGRFSTQCSISAMKVASLEVASRCPLSRIATTR